MRLSLLPSLTCHETPPRPRATAPHKGDRQCVNLAKVAGKRASYLLTQRYAPALFAWGQCLLEQERYEEALDAFKEARAHRFANSTALLLRMCVSFLFPGRALLV